MFIKYLAQSKCIRVYNIMTIVIKFYNLGQGFLRNLIKAVGVLFLLYILRCLPSSFSSQPTPRLHQTHRVLHFHQVLAPSRCPLHFNTQRNTDAQSSYEISKHNLKHLNSSELSEGFLQDFNLYTAKYYTLLPTRNHFMLAAKYLPVSASVRMLGKPQNTH